MVLGATLLLAGLTALAVSLSRRASAVFASGARVFAGTVDGDLAGPSAPGARELHVESATPFKGGLLVAFAEIADRTEAEQWGGRYLLGRAAELPAPGEDEVYYHDFPGMRVERESGEPLGEVVGYFELPQGFALEVRTARGDFLVPYRAELVARVDADGRAVVLTALGEGLLE